MVIRLTLNIHKPGAARGRKASDDYLTHGMQVDAFAVNGTKQNGQKGLILTHGKA